MAELLNNTCMFLLDRLGVGGSERKTILAANLLAERGYRIHMCFLNTSYDITNTLHSSISILNLNRSGKIDFSAIKKIKHYISENNVDVIWAVNLYPTLYMYLSARTLRSSIRLVGSSNITVFRNRYESFKMFIYAPIIRRLDVFVFGSIKQMESWNTQYHLSMNNSQVVHNGVDIEYFSAESCELVKIEAKKKFGFSANDIVIGMVAQFRIEKAYDDLLVATHSLVKQGYPVKLLLVGGGVEEANIKLIVHELSMEDYVVFSGQLDDVRPALNAMDVFALTSRAVETFSNAALEAMAMDLPVILSNIGGAEEMVVDGVNGYLYPPGEISELTLCLKQLTNKATIKKLGISARNIVAEQFSSDAMVDQYESIIKKYQS